MVPRRVNIDYHIVFDANFYSVPYNLVQELGGKCAQRPRPLSFSTRVSAWLPICVRVVTDTPSPFAEHRPRSHQAHLEWTPSRMVHWARTIGPNTARLFERIMNDKPHPEMGYRSCLGIIRCWAGPTGTHGSRCRAGATNGSVPLSERA